MKTLHMLRAPVAAVTVLWASSSLAQAQHNNKPPSGWNMVFDFLSGKMEQQIQQDFRNISEQIQSGSFYQPVPFLNLDDENFNPFFPGGRRFRNLKSENKEEPLIPRWNPYEVFHQAWLLGRWVEPLGSDESSKGRARPRGPADGDLFVWTLGLRLHEWAYGDDANPYRPVSAAAAKTQRTTQPARRPALLRTPKDLPDTELAIRGYQLFASARDAFKSNQFDRALILTDESITALPNDPALHEFRALCLFALKRYDEASSALYDVLSVQPGWNWPTLASLYSRPELYTEQLRALEAYTREHPQQAGPQLVLAYQYLCMGHPASAYTPLKKASELQAADRVSARLVSALTGPRAWLKANAAATPSPLDKPNPALAGDWTDYLPEGQRITLSLRPLGVFVWRVSEGGGQSHEYGGNWASRDDLIALTSADGKILVGQVTFPAEKRLHFRVVAGGPADPGLRFAQ